MQINELKDKNANRLLNIFINNFVEIKEHTEFNQHISSKLEICKIDMQKCFLSNLTVIDCELCVAFSVVACSVVPF
jgi:hypothetical protein